MMTVKVDNTGRIVFAKQIRERLRIQSGSALSLEESAQGILLRPIRRRASPILQRGLLPHRGEAVKGYDWSRIVEDQREERVQDVPGL